MKAICKRKNCTTVFEKNVPWKDYCSDNCRKIAYTLREANKVMKATKVSLFIIGMLSGSFILEAAEIPREVVAIDGEASNQGYAGMLAVAEGIRNREHLGGVYGANASQKRLNRETPATWQKAMRAWEESKRTNTVRGADHWHNVKAEGHVYWMDSMVITAEVGDHLFFKKA